MFSKTKPIRVYTVTNTKQITKLAQEFAGTKDVELERVIR